MAESGEYGSGVNSASEKSVELYRPSHLYRGFIPQGELDYKQTASSQVLQEVISQGLNPHAESYANSFIWTTPDKEYAKGIVIMRFLVKMSTDADYNTAVREGNSDILPALGTYAIQPETNLYDAEGKSLTPLTNKNSKQVIVDAVADSNYTVNKLDGESRDRLISEFDRPLDEGDSDTIYKATLYLDRMTQSDFTRDHHYNFDNRHMSDVIKEAHDYYVKKGVDANQVKDLLAKGMFTGALELKALAQSMEFK